LRRKKKNDWNQWILWMSYLNGVSFIAWSMAEQNTNGWDKARSDLMFRLWLCLIWVSKERLWCYIDKSVRSGSNRKHEQQWWRDFDGFEQWLLWKIAIHSVSVGGTGAPSFDLQVHACGSSCASESGAPHSEELRFYTTCLLSSSHMSVFQSCLFSVWWTCFNNAYPFPCVKQLNFSVSKDNKRLGCFCFWVFLCFIIINGGVIYVQATSMSVFFNPRGFTLLYLPFVAEWLKWAYLLCGRIFSLHFWIWFLQLNSLTSDCIVNIGIFLTFYGWNYWDTDLWLLLLWYWVQFWRFWAY